MSIWDDPIFKVGDKVKCLYTSGYPQLKEGAEYTVLTYEAPCVTPKFTFPAYTQIDIGDGRTVWCHARRFIKEIT